ncbi:MAG: glycosyltransferase family 39 protein [Mizugakiibacter sp.]|uniref:glycosyltransferase family 39 protein n=1 Tax=Mizugakiibacter sp. TaxID=1972610 RepID=UPI0031C3B106|nr:glycosyltransferase family 39 protein [Xanthomonadaceae bacterium]
MATPQPWTAGRSERGRGAAACALLALIVLRILYLRGYPFNSDEPQHLHVAWAWTQGLLPYRDVFDNHGPLFGLLHAPLLMLVGARPDALMWMRLPMLAWYLLALAATWRLARTLYGDGVARAAMPLVALYPSFFLVAGQFRTDNLWMALWLAALAVRWRWPDRRVPCAASPPACWPARRWRCRRRPCCCSAAPASPPR